MKFQLRYGLHSIATGFRTLSWTCGLLCAVAAYGRESMRSFAVDTPSVHDPVMAFENGIYHLYSTGNGLSHYTSHDMKHWTGCRQGVITDCSPSLRSTAMSRGMMRVVFLLPEAAETNGMPLIPMLSLPKMVHLGSHSVPFGTEFNLCVLTVHCMLLQESGPLR